MTPRAAAAELSLLHARVALKRTAALAYLVGAPGRATNASRTRDELGRMVMQLVTSRQAEVQP